MIVSIYYYMSLREAIGRVTVEQCIETGDESMTQNGETNVQN